LCRARRFIIASRLTVPVWRVKPAMSVNITVSVFCVWVPMGPS
jgi:hypothetical protein